MHILDYTYINSYIWSHMHLPLYRFPSKAFMAHCRVVERVWVLVSPEQGLGCNFIAVELIMISPRYSLTSGNLT